MGAHVAQRGPSRVTSFPLLLDSLVEAVLLVDASGRIVRGNQRFLQWFAVSPARLRRQPLDCLGPLLSSELGVDTWDWMRAVLADPYAQRTVDVVQRLPETRELELYSAPLGADGAYAGRLYLFRDVTREREAVRLKDQFVSTVSHELRTPLTAIQGFIELILDGDAGPINDEVREYLGVVRDNTERLITLVNDLLDVSRLEAGSLQMPFEPVSLTGILEEVARTLRPGIEAKHQSLTLIIDPALPPVRGNPERLTQVVTNLLSNASKYTPPEGAIAVAAACTGAYVQVTVRDTGIGIAASDMPKLFTRFFRADHPVVRQVGGTGLGLFIARSIVDLHGGRLFAESQPGVGSTFGFTIPVDQAPAGTVEHASDIRATAAMMGPGQLVMPSTARTEERCDGDQSARGG
jgi:signal transduction histidine kinase